MSRHQSFRPTATVRRFLWLSGMRTEGTGFSAIPLRYSTGAYTKVYPSAIEVPMFNGATSFDTWLTFAAGALLNAPSFSAQPKNPFD